MRDLKRRGERRMGRRGEEAWGNSRRARHGDVRAALLAALSDGPAHGYELGQRLEQRSGGSWRPSPGSIYPTLQRLADEALVGAEERDGKRIYTITRQGALEAAEYARRGEDTPWKPASDDGSGELRDAVREVRSAAKQVNAVGNDQQRARAKAILVESRRQLYALLANE